MSIKPQPQPQLPPPAQTPDELTFRLNDLERQVERLSNRLLSERLERVRLQRQLAERLDALWEKLSSR